MVDMGYEVFEPWVGKAHMAHLPSSCFRFQDSKTLAVGPPRSCEVVMEWSEEVLGSVDHDPMVINEMPQDPIDGTYDHLV